MTNDQKRIIREASRLIAYVNFDNYPDNADEALSQRIDDLAHHAAAARLDHIVCKLDKAYKQLVG